MKNLVIALAVIVTLTACQAAAAPGLPEPTPEPLPTPTARPAGEDRIRTTGGTAGRPDERPGNAGEGSRSNTAPGGGTRRRPLAGETPGRGEPGTGTPIGLNPGGTGGGTGIPAKAAERNGRNPVPVLAGLLQDPRGRGRPQHFAGMLHPGRPAALRNPPTTPWGTRDTASVSTRTWPT